VHTRATAKSTMISESEARRLVLIGYLLRLASDQARRLPPISSLALLMQHDAIELLLQLASEHVNAGSKMVEFMAYFDLIDAKLDPKTLPHKEAIRRLNKARVAFKHHGTAPSPDDLISFQSTAASFLQEACALVFGVALTDISLAQLVLDSEAKSCLMRADSLIDADATQAAVAIAEAFAHLRRRYRVAPRGSSFRSRMHEVQDWLERQQDRGGWHGRSDALTDLGEAVDELWDEVAFLRTGVDTRRLSIFTSLMPHVGLAMSGQPLVSWRGAESPSRDALEFCYAFVVDSALTLQQQDSLVQRFAIDEWQLRFRSP
jgi:hypothetical protein